MGDWEGEETSDMRNTDYSGDIELSALATEIEVVKLKQTLSTIL